VGSFLLPPGRPGSKVLARAISTTQTPATAEREKWLWIRFFTNFWPGSGSERKTHNPAGDDSGIQIRSHLSYLKENWMRDTVYFVLETENWICWLS